MSTTTTEPPPEQETALPEYAAVAAECGDPQPVIDELTEWLDGQTAPDILAELDEGEATEATLVEEGGSDA